MKKKGVTTLKVAATYIGTVVGAGFATGQEVLQFFNRFGVMGVMGLIITTIMFILFGYIIMKVGSKVHARSYLDIIKHTCGNKLGTIIDIVITIFLFGSFTAMIAGTGALFVQQFNIPSAIGNILMGAITAITVLTGINGVINSISFVVPFLLVAVIGTGVFSFFASPPDISAVANIGGNGLINNWLMAAILYVSYNIVISIAVLGPLGREAKNNSAIRNGAILGGLGLGLASITIYFALSGNISDIVTLEVPMIYIAGRISKSMACFYAVILIAEVYTTAVGSLYGFVSRICDLEKNPANSRLIILIVTVAGLLASQFGFSNIVKFIYPLVGYCGIVLLVCLVVKLGRFFTFGSE